MTDNTVNARLLIESGIITYTLCCLSSYCADCRAAARFILYEFRSHLVSSTLTDTVQVYTYLSYTSKYQDEFSFTILMWEKYLLEILLVINELSFLSLIPL